MRAGAARSLLQLYRGTESKGALSSTSVAWTPQLKAWGEFIPAFLTMQNFGAGERSEGLREVNVHPLVNVVTRDGFAVEAGPESGSRWRVVAVDESSSRVKRLRVEPHDEEFA